MVDYCEKEGCRRQLILRYFEGPTASIDCGKTCDYCISPENVKKQLAMFEKKNSFRFVIIFIYLLILNFNL